MTELKYYDQQGNEQTIEVGVKFLTPRLRSELIKIDSESQKEYRVVQKKAKEQLGDIKSGDPAAIDEAIREKYNANEAATNDMLALAQLTWEWHDKTMLRMFRTIIDYNKIKEEHRSIINSDEFINTVDVEGLKEIITSFRGRYKI